MTNHSCYCTCNLDYPTAHASECPKRQSFDFDQCTCGHDELWSKRIICPDTEVSHSEITIRPEDYVQSWCREPDGSLRIGHVRAAPEGCPTVQVDWFTGPDRHTVTWFPKNALRLVDAPRREKVGLAEDVHSSEVTAVCPLHIHQEDGGPCFRCPDYVGPQSHTCEGYGDGSRGKTTSVICPPCFAKYGYTSPAHQAAHEAELRAGNARPFKRGMRVRMSVARAREVRNDHCLTGVVVGVSLDGKTVHVLDSEGDTTPWNPGSLVRDSEAAPPGEAQSVRFRVQEAAGEFQARGPWRKTREEAKADGERRSEAAQPEAHPDEYGTGFQAGLEAASERRPDLYKKLVACETAHSIDGNGMGVYVPQGLFDQVSEALDAPRSADACPSAMGLRHQYGPGGLCEFCGLVSEAPGAEELQSLRVLAVTAEMHRRQWKNGGDGTDIGTGQSLDRAIAEWRVSRRERGPLLDLAQKAADKRREGPPVDVDAWAEKVAGDAAHPDALGNETETAARNASKACLLGTPGCAVEHPASAEPVEADPRCWPRPAHSERDRDTAEARTHHFADKGRGNCIYCGLDQKLNVNGLVPCRERDSSCGLSSDATSVSSSSLGHSSEPAPGTGATRDKDKRDEEVTRDHVQPAVDKLTASAGSSRDDTVRVSDAALSSSPLHAASDARPDLDACIDIVKNNAAHYAPYIINRIEALRATPNTGVDPYLKRLVQALGDEPDFVGVVQAILVDVRRDTALAIVSKLTDLRAGFIDVDIREHSQWAIDIVMSFASSGSTPKEGT